MRGVEGEEKAEESGENDLSVFSCSTSIVLGGELHLRREEISEHSLQWSGPALSASVPPGSPPNGITTRNRAVSSICWTLLVDLL